jgi:hypothetical protein
LSERPDTRQLSDVPSNTHRRHRTTPAINFDSTHKLWCQVLLMLAAAHAVHALVLEQSPSIYHGEVTDNRSMNLRTCWHGARR